MTWLIYVLTAAFGGANPVQAGANAQLRKSLDLPVWSTIWVYASALLLLFIAQLIAREAFPGSERASHVPWWAWLGGAISIASTMSGLLFAQKMGSGLFTGITLTSSVVTSIALDHFGWLGFQQHAASPLRLTGAALLVTGVWLVARF